MRRSTLVALAAGMMLGWPIPHVAQGQAGIAAQRTQYHHYNPMGQSLNWLFNPQIERELEIVPEQKEKLTSIRSEMSTKMREMYKSFGDLDPSERQQKYYEAYKVLGEETEEKVREVLLAHQLDRLRQIMLQMKLRSAGYGSASALSGEDVSEALGLTEEQKEQLRKKEEEVRADMQEKTQEFYNKLREESRDKLLGVLTEAQRKKLRDLMGDEYEWQPTQLRSSATGNVQIREIRKGN